MRLQRSLLWKPGQTSRPDFIFRHQLVISGVWASDLGASPTLGHLVQERETPRPIMAPTVRATMTLWKAVKWILEILSWKRPEDHLVWHFLPHMQTRVQREFQRNFSSQDRFWLPCIVPDYLTYSFSILYMVPNYIICPFCIYLEKAMAPHSSTLAWKIPWMGEPGRLQSMGLLGVG